MTTADPATGSGTAGPEVFPPTLREVMLRPRWLALLAACLVVAGLFAWLGQWQLSRAIAVTPVAAGQSETVLPIDEVTQPGQYLPDPYVGQRVSVSGSWVPGDFLVVSERYDQGRLGYWVTGQLRLSGTASPTSVAVAVGWTADRGVADAAASALSDAAAAASPATVTGRLISDEGPVAPATDADPQEMTRMSPAALLGRWHDTAGLAVYRPYLTSADGLGGLAAIDSPAPERGSSVNWLNLFYAAEWAVFAGFAFYLWYRVARDAWEKELEELADLAASGNGPDAGP